MLITPPTHGAGPELMVPCPSCGAEAGHKCYFFAPARGITNQEVHASRGEAYQNWKQALSNNGFVVRNG